MNALNKPLLRLAVAIGAALAARDSRERLIELPVGSWQRCEELVRQIRWARLRGWHLAAGELCRDLRYAAASVESELASILRELPATLVTETVATTRDIYEDLLALAEEFDFDRDRRWLSVMTEPIRLEGIYLGPFEICLEWGKPMGSDGPCYHVIAKEPHPAECRDSVTHPHVMDEVLCEGDGRHAVRQALRQGRILDFFSLVAGILRNYNPESPFVELALWYGSTCSDCGAVVSEDESYACQKCGETVCEGCEALCTGCESTVCSNCISACAGCDENYCRGCLGRCGRCRSSVCPGCLDENERCPNCHEKERAEENDESARAANDAALQPQGLGQAAVFA